MKKFLDENFLLSNLTAEHLYHDVAANLPIIDYHCHVNPKEIYENRRFENLFQIWLAGDHYKWRVMRSNGVDEYYITGDAPEKEKFLKFAEALPKAIGNPMYHWCHLELKTYFGYNGILSSDTAEEVWELCKDKLLNDNLTVRDVINKSNVKFIGTTDDPIDSLEWHIKLKQDNTFNCIVAPSFRPDKALNLEKDGWENYIEVLSQVSGVKINSADDLKLALTNRIDYFNSCGCKASDHGLDYMFFVDCSDTSANEIFTKAVEGTPLSIGEIESFKTNLIQHCAKEYKKRGWAMQLHYNCLRNTNSLMFKKLGPDTGFDCMGTKDASMALAKMLDSLYSTDSLPKTIIYSLNPVENASIDTIIGAFQGTEIAGKIQHGSAWWFNDNKVGMQEQLTSLANLSLLGNFVGMLTDSRSFLSYTRHEYFRRILCDLIGRWVESGEYPNDEKVLNEIISGICYENAKKYFEI